VAEGINNRSENEKLRNGGAAVKAVDVTLV